MDLWVICRGVAAPATVLVRLLVAASLALAGCGGKVGELVSKIPGSQPPAGFHSDSFQEALGGDGTDDEADDDANGGPTSGDPVDSMDPPVARYRVLGIPVNHLEMTDIYAYAGSPSYPGFGFNEYFRAETNCRGDKCTVNSRVSDGTRAAVDSMALGLTLGGSANYFNENYGIGRISSDENTYSINDIWDTGSNFDNYAWEHIAGVIGQYSSILAFAKIYPWKSYGDLSSWPHNYPPAYVGDGVVEDAHAAAFGSRYEHRPSVSATWSGDMRGVHMRYGNLLQGDARLVYSAAANTVDVEISNVRQFLPPNGRVEYYRGYSGSTGFVWRNLPVNSDGSFYMRGHSNDRQSESPHPTLGFVDGDFYGPNADETAGVFERDFVAGAWLAER